ncbi:unnamed protein product [Staurois parvus]|uniref:Uncharacterized protein n=1 Tax=Staurois parvus TaxID=386267 RepID=A0ABN9B549_9NEOB|nr:unnamed protein product [Staurois parvus]
MVGRWQGRGGWPFINGLPAPCLCALPGSAQNHDPVPLCPPDTVEHQSSYGTSVRGPDHVITDCPISDHMQSSKQDVNCDIIAYYVRNL